MQDLGALEGVCIVQPTEEPAGARYFGLCTLDQLFSACRAGCSAFVPLIHPVVLPSTITHSLTSN